MITLSLEMGVAVRGVVRQRLSDQIAQHLREMIVEGDLAVGSALPSERELARRFGVSSVVIREALNALSVTGLLEIRHGVGSFVTTADNWQVAEPIAALMRSGRADVLHVLEVRAIIEVQMAGLAAERHGASALETLNGALTRMANSLRDPMVNVAADLEFHGALADASGNPIFWLLLQPILAPIHTGMLRGASLPEALEHALEEHRAILAAVAAGDAKEAQAAMLRHMHTARQEALARLSQAGTRHAADYPR